MDRRVNKYPLLIIVSICLLFLKVAPAFPEQIVIDSAGQFGFARTCMEKGEYERAAFEFERFIHFFPDSSQVPTAHYLIGMCYFKDRRFDAARDSFFYIISSGADTLLSGNALFMIGESYYQQGVFTEAAYYFGQIIEKSLHLEVKNVATYRLGWTRMHTGRWRDASDVFCQINKFSTFYDSSQELAEQSLRGEKLPVKRPAYAGTLAALIPGLGHVYVSRYRDATVAFLLNGLFIWATVESFNEDHNVLGGILALLSAGWYTGNIYSAVNSTHKYNRKMKNDFIGNLKDQFDLGFFAGRQGYVGLALTCRF
ncbi:MAG: tetratricopeptide repeat protein [Deltaproteobacteria bacterium]|nr:tetratricopeptide repeat protein [Deltaproteobacteria bacterium]